MKRSKIVRLYVLSIAALVTVGSAGAFRKLEIGQIIPPFTLVDVDGIERESDSLWKPLTIVTAVRSIEGMSSRVLNDLADISADYSTDTLAIWVAVLTKPDRNTVLRIPPQLREYVLFDTLGQLDSILGFVVYPSTGVFSARGQLVAYFPLWRKTIKDELRKGIEGSFEPGGGQTAASTWQTTMERGQSLYKAALLIEQNLNDSVVSILELAIRNDSVWLEGTLALVDLLIKKENYSEVTRILRVWRVRSADSPELDFALARVLFATGDPDSALKVLAEGRFISPRPEKFLSFEGEIFYKTLRPDSAAARWREAVELLLGRRHE